MSYDHANRVTRVTNPATGETVGRYHYDDQGFRVRKTALDDDGVDRKETMLLYASMYFGVEIQKDVYTGEEIYNVMNNIYLNGVRVAAMVPTGEAAHFHTDQVDSVKVVTNDAGAVVSRMEYLPYGETWFQEGDDRFAPKYNSQELDRESGYYFYNARHYDPQICRFVTADTVIDGEFDTQGWNRFAYAKGNPILYKDPTGHDSLIVVSNDKVANNKSYNTYKGYIYKDMQVAGKTIFSAETKNMIDESLGIRFLNKGELEITRDAKMSGYGTKGSMPPTGKNGTSERYEVRKGYARGSEKFRIGEADKFPADRSNLEANASNTKIKNPTRPGDRSLFNFDPYNNPRELEGCLGISKKYGSSYYKPNQDESRSSAERRAFRELNRDLEEAIPDLKSVNKSRADGGQRVNIIVKDLFDNQ